MAYLFTPYRRRGQDSSFGKLIDIVSGLKDCDVAVLAGFAKLLAGGKVEIDDVAVLLAWRDTIYDEN
jgi:predicted transcriptional regulator